MSPMSESSDATGAAIRKIINLEQRALKLRTFPPEPRTLLTISYMRQ